VLVAIKRVEYLCDGWSGGGRADAGLCTVNDGGRPDFQHFFKKSPPLYDPRTQEVVGPVTVRQKGIHDWPGGEAPSSDGRPASRIGRLVAFDLANGQPIYFGVGRYGLWTDSTGTRLIVKQENPVDLLSTLPPVENPAHFERLKGSPELAAVAFILPGCELCEKAAPSMVGMKRHFGELWAFDGERFGDLALAEGVKAAPTIVLYRAGGKVATITRIAEVAKRLDACALTVLRKAR
jgi:hypothetical protein